MIAHASTLKQVENESPVSFTEILPAIVKALRFEFRKLDDEKREDAIHEAVANCFVAYRRLIDQGRGSLIYPSVLAGFAARQVRDGRMVGGSMNVSVKQSTSRGGLHPPQGAAGTAVFEGVAGFQLARLQNAARMGHRPAIGEQVTQGRSIGGSQRGETPQNIGEIRRDVEVIQPGTLHERVQCGRRSAAAEASEKQVILAIM